MPAGKGNVYKGDKVAKAERDAKKGGYPYIAPTPISNPTIKQQANISDITTVRKNVKSESIIDKARKEADNLAEENGFNAKETRGWAEKVNEGEASAVKDLPSPEKVNEKDSKAPPADIPSIVPEPIVPSLPDTDIDSKSAVTPDITKEDVTNKNIQSATPIQSNKPQKSPDLGTAQDALKELSDVGAEIQRQSTQQETLFRNPERQPMQEDSEIGISERRSSGRSQPPQISAGMDPEMKTILMGQTEYLALIVELLGTISDKLDIEEPES